jgi:hypothetical protein
VSSALNSTTCVLTHEHTLILWKSASSSRLRVEDWQQHGDGMQRVRIVNLGGKSAACSGFAWVELSQQYPHADSSSGGRLLPDDGALAMLLGSGLLMLYNDNGDMVHHQQIFHPDANLAVHWRPVCSYRSGKLLLTAPNAVYIIQDQDVARALHRNVTKTSCLAVTACPLPTNISAPQ